MSELLPPDNPSGADNEQGSPTEAELAWLAGHFDGEGWTGIQRVKRSNSRHLRYTAATTIATTSERAKDHTVRIYNALGVTINLIEFKPEFKRESWHRRKWNISTRTNASTRVLLTAIRPYLIEKHLQADMVLAYVERRDSLPHRPSDEDNENLKRYAEELRAALVLDRQRDDPSTTTRLAPATAG